MMWRRTDSWAGLLCVAIGGVTLWQANSYSIGTLAQMGPGFYPAILGVLLTGVGVLIVLAGGAPVEADPLHDMPAGPEWRGRLCILGGMAVFILTVERLGMVMATFGCVLVAAMGDRRATLSASVALAGAITVFGALLFHGLLGIALPLWP
jgi:hypothetical protein